MDGFDKFLQLLQKHNYGDLILGTIELIGILAGIIYAGKDRIGKAFIIYIAIDLFILLSGWWVLCFSNINLRQEYNFIAISNSFISLVEILAYYYFFWIVLDSPKARSILKIQGAIFLILFILLITTRLDFLFERFSYASNLVSVIGFFFMLPPCAMFYIKLLTDNPVDDLFKRPSFWITTGIFSYSLFSIPYYLIDRLLIGNNYEYRYIVSSLFFYLPFTLNILFLTRAFICRRALTI